MDEEENMQSYQLNQGENEYILTTGLVDGNIRLTCQENISLTGPYYANDFSLEQLCSIHKYFNLISTIQEAQYELNKAIERQRVGIRKENDLLNVIFYLHVGTDKINLTLPLKKQDNLYKVVENENQPQFVTKLNLLNRGTYPRDEQRIIKLEGDNYDIKKNQKSLNTDIENILELSKQLINRTYFLKEDNAKLRERLRQIKEEIASRKEEISDLKSEDMELRQENNKLNTDIQRLEKMLQEKEDHLRRSLENNMPLNEGDDSDKIGPMASTVKFAQPQIKTFVPRPSAKPIGQTYIDSKDKISQSKNSFL